MSAAQYLIDKINIKKVMGVLIKEGGGETKLTPEQEMGYKIYKEYENLTWEESCERYNKKYKDRTLEEMIIEIINGEK